MTDDDDEIMERREGLQLADGDVILSYFMFLPLRTAYHSTPI